MQTKSIAIVAGAAAAGGVLALAGLNLATAATGSQDAVMGQAGPMGGQYGPGGPGRGPHGTPVTGEAADQVTAAVQAQYPDATVMFIEEEGDGYEAHVRKADGTMVHVTLDADFQITGEHTGPAMGGPGGPGRMGPGHHGKLLTGVKAKKVKAAAKAELPNATVIRVEKERNGYEAHMVKVDGTHVVVSVGKRFRVTDVETMPAPGRMGPAPAAPQSEPASA